MFQYDKNKHKFFGERAYYSNEEEKNEAKIYLEYWKKNLIKKLCRDSFDVKIEDEQWGEYPSHLFGILAQQSCIYLKICLEADFHYELGKNL